MTVIKPIRAVGSQAIGTNQSPEQNYKIKILQGQEMAPWLKDLAKMEILYEEWPYLCRANLEDDIAGIERIMNLNGIACVAFDEKRKVIGVAMGRAQELVSCVKKAFPEETRVFHMQHWLVLPEHRKNKVASTLLKTLENHVKATGLYDRISCATILRPDDFRIAKPADAFSLEEAFQKRSYSRFKPETPFFFEWTLIDESSDSMQPMALWMKNLQ